MKKQATIRGGTRDGTTCPDDFPLGHRVRWADCECGEAFLIEGEFRGIHRCPHCDEVGFLESDPGDEVPESPTPEPPDPPAVEARDPAPARLAIAGCVGLLVVLLVLGSGVDWWGNATALRVAFDDAVRTFFFYAAIAICCCVALCVAGFIFFWRSFG
jgi:hypothetical protein